MAVTTIDLNDFLVQKHEGDVVTGEDWNKLIALFYAVNNNANTLLDTIKNVDINAANIAQVSQGAVPDGSIGYSKLEKIGGTKNTYKLTTDTIPKTGVTYFTLEGNTYTPHAGLTAFTPGVRYYVLEVTATGAAIADGDVIGDGVIENYHLAPNTILPSACSEQLFRELFNSSATVYTNKGVSGTFPAATTPTTVEHTITLDKQHKALIIVQPFSLIFLTADANKPNLFIGSSHAKFNKNGADYGKLYSDGLYIKSLVGADKENAPQAVEAPWAFDAADVFLPVEPCGLLGDIDSCSMQLQRCVYDYATKRIFIKIQTLSSGKNYYQNETYNFGSLIIGF